MNHGLSPPKLHDVQSSSTGCCTSSHSALGPLLWRKKRTTRSGRDDPSTTPPLEAIWRPARDQDQENRHPGFSRPSRLSLRTSRLRSSSTVAFLLNLYQLPLPTPPMKVFSSTFSRNH